MDFTNIERQVVRYIPIAFKRDIMFELSPPTLTSRKVGQLSGIICRHDGHTWTTTKTSRIQNDDNLKFSYVTWVTWNMLTMFASTMSCMENQMLVFLMVLLLIQW
jgi:hypothetical protein